MTPSSPQTARSQETATDSASPAPQLSTALHREAFATTYARNGRVHIRDVLTRESAERTFRCLSHETPWQLHLNDGEKNFDLGEEQVALLSPADRSRLMQRVASNARQQFQYVYHSFPVHDAWHLGRHSSSYLMRLYEFLNGADFLGLARDVTGSREIEFADAQATLYRPGHFLTQHDDREAGKGRIAAYVLTFTPEWRADWGGVLQFLDDDGHVTGGFTPTFNSLSLFRVPQKHAVTFVAPFAPAGRYSISGWLRRRDR